MRGAPICLIFSLITVFRICPLVYPLDNMFMVEGIVANNTMIVVNVIIFLWLWIISFFGIGFCSVRLSPFAWCDS